MVSAPAAAARRAVQRRTGEEPAKIHVPSEEVVKMFRDLQREKGLSDAGAATICGRSATAISQWLRGVYPGAPENVEDAIRKAVAQEQQSEGFARPAYKFIETEVHRRNVTYMRMTKALNHFTVLAGPAGLGKTRSAKFVQREVPNVVYHELTQHSCTGSGLISALRGKVWASRRGTKRRYVDDFFAAIAERDIMLIIDQAHQLRDSGLEMIFDIRNATGKPVVLIANEKLLRRIHGVEEQEIEDNEQWARRVNLKPPYDPCYDGEDKPVVNAKQSAVHWYSLAEIAEFVAQFPIQADDRFLVECRKIADGAGHLGALDVRLNLVLQFNNMPPIAALARAKAYAFKMRTAEEVARGE